MNNFMFEQPGVEEREVLERREQNFREVTAAKYRMSLRILIRRRTGNEMSRCIPQVKDYLFDTRPLL